MARCGCAGGGACNCTIEPGAGISVSGAGTPESPYVVSYDEVAQAVKTVSANYTLTNKDRVVLAQGTHTIKLPPAAGSSGRILCVINIGSGTITVSGNGVNINGSATKTLDQWDSLVVVSNGTKWFRYADSSDTGGGGGGSGPVGALEQLDLSPPANGFLDPSTFADDVDDASAMSYVSASAPANPDPGEPGIRVEAGWYLAYAMLDVATASAQPIKLRITSPEGFGEPATGYMPPGATVSGELTCTTAFHFNAPGLIAVDIDNPGLATIAFGRITVVKLS